MAEEEHLEDDRIPVQAPDEATLKRQFDDWHRVRNAIEHENELVNHRVTWLLVSQGALFAAFGTMFSKWLESPSNSITALPLFMISFLGVVLCANIYVNISAAHTQLGRLTKWWYREAYQRVEGPKLETKDPRYLEACAAYDRMLLYHPPLHLWHELDLHANKLPQWKFSRAFQTAVLPFYFISGWFGLGVGIVVRSASEEAWENLLAAFSTLFPFLVTAVLIGVVLWAGMALRRRLRR